MMKIKNVFFVLAMIIASASIAAIVKAEDCGIEGKIIVNLSEQGKVPEAGISKADISVKFSNDNCGADGSANASTTIEHTGLEERTDINNTMIKSAYGRNEVVVNLPHLSPGGDAVVNYSTKLSTKISTQESFTGDGAVNQTYGKAENLVIVNFNDKLGPEEITNYSTGADNTSNSAVYITADKKYIGAETSSQGNYHKQDGAIEFNNSGIAEVGRNISTPAGQNANTGMKSFYSSGNPGDKYTARSGTYADLVTFPNGKSFYGETTGSIQKNESD